MGYRQRLHSVTAWVAAGALALNAATPAYAAPPPIPSAYPAATPPGRVGRLAKLTGTVSFHTADAEHWDPATLNYPVTSGNDFWTEPHAQADIEIAASRIVMDGATELDMNTLDDHALAAAEPQGEVYLHLVNVPDGDTTTIQTPRGAVQITAAGRYAVAAGDASAPTVVTVLEGAVQITGANLSLQVGPRQTASINGTDSFQGTVGPLAQDAFLTAALAAEQPAPRESGVAIPPVVGRMTGCGELAQYGSWKATPQYGAVWYPQVASGYVPYRNGHWSYVAPWGWTWIDAAPWGFAPFHYGRWVQVDDRWGWAPADAGYAPAPDQPVLAYPEPVYAPALVSFVDLGAAVAVGASVGLAAGAFAGRAGDRGRNVGWVPLGPGEPYYPPYNHDPAYVRNLNVTNIRNVNQVINTTTINNRVSVQTLVNRGGATVVPVSAMVQSAPIGPAVQTVPAQRFGALRAEPGAPVRPVGVTAGVTPGIVRDLRLSPGEPAGVAAHPAPGPSIGPAAFRPGAAPRGVAGPALRPAGQVAPEAARPNEAPSIRPVEPGAALPPLRPAGEPPRTPGEASRPAEPHAPIAPTRPEAPAARPPRPQAPAPVGRPETFNPVARPAQVQPPRAPSPPTRPAEPPRPAFAAPPRAAEPPRAPPPRFAPPPQAAPPPRPSFSPRPPPPQAAPPPRPAPAPASRPGGGGRQEDHRGDHR